jgi:hypothetical protein
VPKQVSCSCRFARVCPRRENAIHSSHSRRAKRSHLMRAPRTCTCRRERKTQSTSQKYQNNCDNQALQPSSPKTTPIALHLSLPASMPNSIDSGSTSCGRCSSSMRAASRNVAMVGVNFSYCTRMLYMVPTVGRDLACVYITTPITASHECTHPAQLGCNLGLTIPESEVKSWHWGSAATGPAAQSPVAMAPCACAGQAG